MNDYHNTTSITSLLNQLEWSPLSVRQRNSRLVAFYKAANNPSPVSSWSTASLLSSNQVVWPTNIHSSHSSNRLLQVLLLTAHHCRLELAAVLTTSQAVGWFIPCTSLSLHHHTEQNHNTPAVTGHAHFTGVPKYMGVITVQSRENSVNERCLDWNDYVALLVHPHAPGHSVIGDKFWQDSALNAGVQNRLQRISSFKVT